ncbi:uncharacterized protein MKK02DRAFT_28183 [Dioszegia hungarica]|uniref:RRM domain-containing protein n=1 Tax=Dioszegia hungarica TaxID=4972 RepID=A0AA38LUV8_9TREE|nr:uncharacterized protein MKK02DRAFT_28183 [Dioszegia hungarica]KAI9634441.1 hypothetical protein MKK02DRAFT_28183 [Dioszegia hungarica]
MIPFPTPGNGLPSRSFTKPLNSINVYVGCIAPGIENAILIELLNLNRGRNKGKPEAYGFVSIEDPEVVRRCIRCLSGVRLPDLSPEGIREKRPAKALVLRVDEKAMAFKQTSGSTVDCELDDNTADAAARDIIAVIIARLGQVHTALAREPVTRASGGQTPINVIVPAHLQNLRVGDLPEKQRVVCLDQICVFRENAAWLDREQKLREEQTKMALIYNPGGYKRPPSPSAYGYGPRGFQWNASTSSASSQYPPGGRDRPPPQMHGGDLTARAKRSLHSAGRSTHRRGRHSRRTKEHQEDVRDQQANMVKHEAGERESWGSVTEQTQELARVEEVEMQRGLVSDKAAPINCVEPPEPPITRRPTARAKARLAPAIAFAFDVDDEEKVAANKRKQRSFNQTRPQYAQHQYDGPLFGGHYAGDFSLRRQQDTRVNTNKALPAVPDSRGVRFGAAPP